MCSIYLLNCQVDLTDYEKSGTWDVISVPAEINVTYDEKTKHNISRAYYNVHLRRKTLFYTVNLIIPSVLISCLSMVSFYLPTTAGEKITMSVSILLALVVFLQVRSRLCIYFGLFVCLFVCLSVGGDN